MKKSFPHLFFLFWLISSASAQSVPASPFFGFPENSTEASILLPSVVSTNSMETNGSFSPDGRMFLYTIQFLHASPTTIYMQLKDNKWTEPEIARFSGNYSDIDPVFSPDGKRIYFNSARPINKALAENHDMNIWYVDILENGFSEPMPVSLTINTPEHQFYCSLSKKGTIFFHSRNEQSGSMDIYKATLKDEEYIVELMDSTINSQHSEADPYISPDEDYIIFSSDRPNGFGSYDLYVSFAIGKGWSTPVNLGKEINSEAKEYAPNITSDGRILIFTSNKMVEFWAPDHKKDYRTLMSKINSPDNELDNIWWVNTNIITELKNQQTASSREDK